MSRRRLWSLALVVGAGAAIFGGSAIWRANATLGEVRQAVSSEGTLRITDRIFPTSSLRATRLLGPSSSIVDGQVFQGDLYLAGPSGLSRYDSRFQLIQEYQTGKEFPPAKITALASGVAGSTQVLWIATWGEGLVEFDGSKLRQIVPDDPKYRKISSLLPLSTGKVLLGTEKAGVAVWDGHEMRRFHPSLNNLPVTALAGDDSSVWVGTLDRGLVHWNAGGVETLNDSLPDHQILSLARAGETVYAGTGLGIAEIQGGKLERTLTTGYLAQSLLADGGKLWMGTLEEGMREIPLESHGGRAVLIEAGRGCGDCSVRRILRLDDSVYALTDRGVWKNGSEQVLKPARGALKDGNISALATDSTGTMWVGYFDRGLQTLQADGSRSTDWEDDHLFCINRIVHDSVRGTTAVATSNGLVLFNRSSDRRVIGQAQGLIANQVTDVAIRPDGSMIAATPAGLSFLEGGSISSIYAFQGLVNNHVYTLAFDGPSTLAGTLGGLSVLDGMLVKTSYTTSNSALKHNWITAIAHQGRDYFVGTYGAGVLRFTSSGRWETFDDLRGLLEINPNAMAVSKRAIYAGTLDHGLAIYDVSNGRWHFATDGLPSKNVTAVDVSGRMIHIGTDNGLLLVSEDDLLK